MQTPNRPFEQRDIPQTAPTSEFPSLVELLRYRAAHQATQRAYTFLTDGETAEIHLTYAELDRQARTIAVWLQSQNASGERVLLLYPAGLEYIAAFFGCLYAGCVAVPAYPPRLNHPDTRLPVLAADAQATLALTTTPILAHLESRLAHAPALAALQWLATDTLNPDDTVAWQNPVVNPHTLAFLQYTSGSTAAPKGVMVSHANLLHNQQLIKHTFAHTAETVIAGWLPLYHDMGLIGTVLQPLYLGVPCILMSPLAFLQKPLRWLQAISHYRVTTSGAPNFAYDLCARKITPEQRVGLDLSSWAVAFNGAEPVRLDTLTRFAVAFEPYGFQREAFMACYGLAEATLLVAGSLPRVFPVTQTLQGAALEHGQVTTAATGTKGSRALVGCGQTGADQQIAIVDPTTGALCPFNRVGEIWVSGPSVARGYWNKPAETKQTFQAYLAGGAGPFLRTGDLGFMRHNELFITGRLKDVIIIRGRNYYPQDIELAVEQSHPALQPGGGAAFTVEVAGAERLVVAHEVQRQHRQPDVAAVAQAARETVAENFGLSVYAVVLLKPGSLAKTSSGKVQRQANRDRWLSNSLEIIGRSILDDSYFEQGQDDLVDAASLAPRTPTEELLVQIWADILQLETVGIYENFFALGGHSLLLTQLMSRLRESFQVELSLRVLFETPTIAGLAHHIDQFRQGQSPALAPALPIQPVPRVGALPLSFSQERMWFLHQLTPGSAAYHVSVALRLEGPLDTSVLERCLNEVARRHESLRTTFPVIAGRPAQVIAPALTLPLPVMSLRHLPPAEREAAARRLATVETQRPFDLAQGPLIRAVVFQFNANDHILLVVMHHIVSDAWSLSVFWQEIAALYAAFVTGAASPLTELPWQYADFAGWQRQRLDEIALEAQWVYWKRQLAGAPLVLELPTDRPRPAVQTFHGAYQTLSLAPSLLEALRTISRRENATLFMTLLAAFKALLYRYTGQTDLVIGTPIANRHWLASEKLIGTLVNTLALRANLSGNPTFRELLGRVRETALAAYAHQDLSFEQLVHELQPQRDLSHSPLFQVMFSVANPPLPVVQLPQLAWRIFEFDREAAQFDLTLSLVDTKQIQMMSVEYNTDLFDHATISRMIGHWQVLLESIVATGGELRLLDLSLLTAPEHQQLLVEWNDTGVDYLLAGLPQLFEAQVERTPDATAVIFEDELLTYRALNQRANQLAHYLRALGVGPEVGVGIYLQRSPEMLVGLLGILKAGGAYVPLDPAFPPQRLDFMLHDSGAPLLLTQTDLQSTLPACQAQVVCLDADWPAIAACSIENPAPVGSPENLAYIIYTSGSTGAPKGVEIPQRAVVNFLQAMQQQFQLTGRDTLLAVTTLSFDIAVLELFLPLISGAAVVIADRQLAADGVRLSQKLSDSGATIMQATPATWRLLLDAGWIGHPQLTILCGGEALPVELAQQLLPKCADLWNMYGPTETTVWSTMHQVKTGAEAALIGRPIANTQVYVLDAQLQPSPVGVPGDLYIGGAGLARGYHQRPDLTAAGFIPNPFVKMKGENNSHPSGLLYKTGDVARYRPPGGRLEYLGRSDHQVKLRGFRIELGEIEAVLSRQPTVGQVVVMVREDTPGDKRLVAYVTPRQEAIAPTDELRRFARETLPEYMVPAVFVTLNALPLTPNRKVDRRALPPPNLLRPELAETFIAPQTEIEITLAQIWSQILGINQIGLHDNFFDLGGHSMLVMQAMARAREAFQLELPLRVFFEKPTIAELANLIKNKLIAEIEALTEEQAKQLAGSLNNS